MPHAAIATYPFHNLFIRLTFFRTKGRCAELPWYQPQIHVFIKALADKPKPGGTSCQQTLIRSFYAQGASGCFLYRVFHRCTF
jgi:hypothetical protein